MVTLIKLASMFCDKQILESFLAAAIQLSKTDAVQNNSKSIASTFNSSIFSKNVGPNFDFRQPLIATSMILSLNDITSPEFYPLAKYLLNVQKDNFGNWLPMIRYLIGKQKFELANQW